MLQIDLPGVELWDDKKEVFVTFKPTHLSLEHSLVSVAKWEQKWEKAFLKTREKTREEMNDYVRCMTLTQNVDPEIYNHLPNEVITRVNEYINRPMTAIYFPEDKNGAPNRDIMTNELIYYYMFTNNIPIECQKWHLNHLIALIRVFAMKNQDPKKRKMSTAEIMRRNTQLNEERLRKNHTTG